MTAINFQSLLKFTCLSLTFSTTIYFGLLGLLTIPFFQTHAVYLHRVTLTWFKDLNVPESFGFLHKQVTPFSVSTTDGETLYAWHILPLDLYRRNEGDLIAEPSGFAHDITSRLAFRLLRDDPDAWLVIYLHGTAGTVGSGWRPDSYRALCSGAPDKIHILTVEYRGFGRSSGTPSENGLTIDAISLTNWAMGVANIPASRIVIFGQSLGTAVGISLSHYFASQNPPVSFAGMVLVASFSDMATLTSTYRLGGVIPVLSPLRGFPRLLKFFTGYLQSTWLSKDRISEFIRLSEANGEKYHITMIAAENDDFIPWNHTEAMYWHAVNATIPMGISYDQLEKEKETRKTDLGHGGWTMEWTTKKGSIREEILKHGLHDQLMSWPATAMAALRTFQAADSASGRGDRFIDGQTVLLAQ
jgi:abhydrolase domain-containing protein 12